MDTNFKTLNALMRHIRTTSDLSIGGSGDKRALARVGYFHGYKGYRYSGTPTRYIPYSDFAQLQAVVDFDSKLKATLYPILMKIEMCMKNLALPVILDAANSSALPDVYARLMPGTKRNKRRGKLEVIHASNSALLSAYKRKSAIVMHYYDSPHEAVPAWALMEIITLGHFARLLEQLSDPVLNDVSRSWGMQRRDGGLVPHLVFAITDLRNAVAHNGTVFDTRFRTGRIRENVSQLIVREIDYADPIRVNFSTITDYVVLTTYLAIKLGFTKTEVKTFVRQYTAHTDELHGRVPVQIFDMIVHVDNRAKIGRLEEWVRAR